jgi:hypothetical protein
MRTLPAYFSDNYISLLPGEKRTIAIAFPVGATTSALGMRGWNLAGQQIAIR